MRDLGVPVQIIYGGDELLKVVARLILVYRRPSDNIVKELSALCQLHHKEYVGLRLNDFV